MNPFRPLAVLSLLLCPTPVFALEVAFQDKAAPAVVAVHERIRERCQAELDGVFERGSFPGGSVGLVLPDGSEMSLTVGHADREQQVAMAPSHRFLSASIGKVYVSAMAHRLIAEGKLDPDRKASEYLGDLDWFERLPNADSFTVRQLMRHQSGLPRYVFKPAFWKTLLEEPEKHWQPKDMLSFVFDDAALFEAGAGWTYSDTNFIVVGMILEKISGTAFYEYVQQQFLKLHGLKDTIPTNTREIPNMAQGYVVVSQQFGLDDRSLDEDGRFRFNPQFEWCGGGWAQTPLDLARWARILYSGKAFEGEYLATMLDTVPAPALGPNTHYGLGVMVRDTPAGKMIGHDGFMPGYLSSMGYFPESKIAAAFQVNTDNARDVGTMLPAVITSLVEIAKEELE